MISFIATLKLIGFLLWVLSALTMLYIGVYRFICWTKRPRCKVCRNYEACMVELEQDGIPEPYCCEDFLSCNTKPRCRRPGPRT